MRRSGFPDGSTPLNRVERGLSKNLIVSPAGLLSANYEGGGCRALAAASFYLDREMFMRISFYQMRKPFAGGLPG